MVCDPEISPITRTFRSGFEHQVHGRCEPESLGILDRRCIVVDSRREIRICTIVRSMMPSSTMVACVRRVSERLDEMNFRLRILRDPFQATTIAGQR